MNEYAIKMDKKMRSEAREVGYSYHQVCRVLEPSESHKLFLQAGLVTPFKAKWGEAGAKALVERLEA